MMEKLEIAYRRGQVDFRTWMAPLNPFGSDDPLARLSWEWGYQAAKALRAQRQLTHRIASLEGMITDLLLSADAVWEQPDSGNDWAAAVMEARALLSPTPGTAPPIGPAAPDPRGERA